MSLRILLVRTLIKINMLTICGFYVDFIYVMSLRGSEGFMLNITIMSERTDSGIKI